MDEEEINNLSRTLIEYISNLDVDKITSGPKKQDLKSKRQQYRYYLPVELNGAACKAMIDSGNSYANVMSEDLMKFLKLSIKDLTPLSGVKLVGTARTGAGMRILGRVKKPIAMKVHDKLTFLIRPVVLKGLSMPLNICGPFLQFHKIDQLHSEGCLRYERLKLPLVAMLGSDVVEEQLADKYPILIKDDISVPAMSCSMVEAEVPNAEGIQFHFDALVEGSIEFMEGTNLHPWVSVINTCNPGGMLKVGVMNTLAYPVTLKAGSPYGSLYPTLTPHCVAGIDVMNGPTTKQTERRSSSTVEPSDEEKRQILIERLRCRKVHFYRHPWKWKRL